MKSLTISILMLTLFSTIAMCEVQGIVCGTQPGEIYFTGVHPFLTGTTGFYFSADGGEHIELRDSSDWTTSVYGSLLSDAQDSTLYRFVNSGLLCPGQYLSVDGGFNWNIVDTVESIRAYASGVISGEVYRRAEFPTLNRLERSENYGVGYHPCNCIGLPDTFGIYSTALGIDSGEVYIWGDFGNLYYSQDYAESFTFLGDLYTTWGVNPWTHIINGAVPGEIFIFYFDHQKVWRVSNYGTQVEMLINLSLGYSWACSFASSRIPGELYIRATEYLGMVPGGTIRIYHTTDYFQSWTIYEHIVEWENINDQNIPMNPSPISMQTWPNPANAGFNVSYELNSMQDVRLEMYNMLGQKVWTYHVGMQAPRNYRLYFQNEQLPSGTYLLQLRAEEEQISRMISIIK